MGMFDDLVPSAEASAPAPKGGGMFDDLVPAAGPIASQFSGPDMSENFGGAPLPPEPAPQQPASAFAPPESVMPAPASIADRFKINAREGFDNTLAGEVVNRVQSGQVDQTEADNLSRAIVEARLANSPVGLDVFQPSAADKASKFPGLHQPEPNPYAGIPLPRLEADFNRASKAAEAKSNEFGAKREAQAAETAALPSFTEAPTLKDKAIQGAVALAGEMAGGFASPENLIGGPGKGAAVRVGEGLLARAAREAAPGVVAGAAGSAVAAPAVAASKAERGEGEGLTGAGLGESVALGAAVGGAFHLPGIIARPLLEAIGRRRGVAVDHVDPATVGPAEIQEAFKDPQIAALAKANGIESPADPRVAVLEDKIAARKGEEALRTPDQPVQSLRAQDAEVGRRQGEVSGVKDETIDPAATNIIKRTPDETPIRVDSEGNAFRADAGALEGKAKAEALQRADMKFLPAPDRLPYETPTDEGANVQHRGTQGDRPHGGYEDVNPEPPPKLYGGENRLPEAADGRALVDYANQKTSTKAAPVDESGKFATDPNGYVASDRGGPVRFAQEKQAEKFVASQGKKTGQDFEVVEHPAGKGFTVQERAPEAEAQRQITDQRQPAPAAAGEPRQLEDQRSYGDKVAAERDRLWAEEMPGYKRTKVGNDGMVEASARETVMRHEAAEQVARAEQTHGIPQESIHEVAQLYRRGENETPQQAWERAVDRWGEKNENAALDHLHTLDEADRNFDTLKSEGGVDTLYTDNHEAIHGPEVDHEAIPLDSSDHEGTQGDGQPVSGHRESGADGENGREAAGAQARSEGGVTRGQAGSGRETASGHTDAGPDGKRQTVIPGAERLTDRALAERQGSKPLRGGDEPPPKGGLFDEDVRNQSDMFDPTRTMHANPLFDPAVWKWMGKKGLGFDDAWRRDMTGFATDWAKMKEADGLKGGKGNSLYQRLFSKNFSTYLFNSVDAELRALGKLHGDSQTIKGLSDSLQPIADVGRGGAVTQGFHEGVAERIGNGTNRLAKALEPFLDRPNAINQIVNLVQNRRSIKSGTPIHDAAAAIAKLLDDTHKYLTEAGVKVGKTPDYYPRSEIDSIKAISNPAAIQADMAKAYRASGLTATEAREAAEHWFERISLGSVNVRPDGTDFLIHGGMPSSNFAKERVFSKEAHAFMEKWYHNDPTDAIPVYLQRAARRAEWARMMGGEVKDKTGKMVWDDNGKWKQMKADLIKEGNAGAVPEVVRLISAATGVNPPAMPSVGRSALGLIRTMAVMKLLPHATLTNLTDMLMPGVRSGSVPRAVGDVFRTVKALLHTADMETTRAFAEDLGLITHGSTSGVMAARYNMDNPGNLLQERLQNRFWRGIGMEQLNQATRTVGTKSAEVFIRRQALDVAAGNKQATLSRRLLTELGVKDVDGFSKWVKGAENPRGDINSTGHADTYRNAVVRFVNQASLLPTKSTKPSWANHPVGGLIYILQSYNQAFMRDVYGRAKVQVGMAVSPKSGLSGMERARILTPIAMLPGLMAAQLAVGIPRQAILGSAGKQTETSDEAVAQLVIQAASRSLTASLDPFVQLYTSAKYHKSAGDFLHGSALSGPVNMIDALVGLLPKTASGGSNSDKTNSAERNAVRTTYDNILAPLVLSGTSMLPPQLGVPLSQAVTAGPVKDQLIDAVAGPKQTHSSGRPTRPTRPTHK